MSSYSKPKEQNPEQSASVVNQNIDRSERIALFRVS